MTAGWRRGKKKKSGRKNSHFGGLGGARWPVVVRAAFALKVGRPRPFPNRPGNRLFHKLPGELGRPHRLHDARRDGTIVAPPCPRPFFALFFKTLRRPTPSPRGLAQAAVRRGRRPPDGLGRMDGRNLTGRSKRGPGTLRPSPVAAVYPFYRLLRRHADVGRRLYRRSRFCHALWKKGRAISITGGSAPKTRRSAGGTLLGPGMAA